MRFALTIVWAMLLIGLSKAVAQPSVRIAPAKLDNQPPLQQATADAAIHNYLQSWQNLRAAFDQNRADLLDADFVGDARDRLGKAIEQQTTLGVRVRYEDRSHDLQIVFHSPEGLSIELTDNVEYDVELFDHDKWKNTSHLHTRYIAILTPSESRWRVRLFQADSQ